MARYGLRQGLELGRDERGWLVRDPELQRAVRLGELDAKLARALRTPATWTELRKRTDLAEDDLQRRLTGLARLYLLGGKRAALRIRLQSERSLLAAPLADDVALHWPPGLDPPRHGCVGTGTCCEATFLGPLTPNDRVRIERLWSGGQAPFERVRLGDTEHVGMARDTPDDACVARTDDRRCDLHARHGESSKPVACRLFPLRLHRSPAGVHVSLLLACDGYHSSRQAGRPWPERALELRALLADGAPTVRMALPMTWTAGVPAPVAAWWPLRDALVALQPTDGDAHAWLAAVLSLVEGHVAAAAAELAEGPHIAWPLAFAHWRTALAEPSALYPAAALATFVAELRTRADGLGPGDAARLRDLAAGLDAQAAGLTARAAGRSPMPGEAMALEPMAARHLCDIVANDLPLQVVLGELEAGLGLLVRRLLLATSLACVLARRDGRSLVNAHDTTRALHVAYRSEPDLVHAASLP